MHAQKHINSLQEGIQDGCDHYTPLSPLKVSLLINTQDFEGGCIRKEQDSSKKPSIS